MSSRYRSVLRPRCVTRRVCVSFVIASGSRCPKQLADPRWAGRCLCLLSVRSISETERRKDRSGQCGPKNRLLSAHSSQRTRTRHSISRARAARRGRPVVRRRRGQPSSDHAPSPHPRQGETYTQAASHCTDSNVHGSQRWPAASIDRISHPHSDTSQQTTRSADSTKKVAVAQDDLGAQQLIRAIAEHRVVLRQVSLRTVRW